MEDRLNNGVHKVSFEDRGRGYITGVIDVLSFDANQVVLETAQGILMLKGIDLHVTRLVVDKGEIEIDGKLDSLTYSDIKTNKKNGENLLGRLFK